MLLFLSLMTLGLFTDGSEFGHNFETIIKTYSVAMFFIVPVICILISAFVRKKIKINDSTPYEMVKYCEEIKTFHKEIYVAFVLLGTICTITVLPVMVDLLIIIVIWSMQFQTGYIGRLGIREMFREGDLDEKTYNNYLKSRYIIFKDIEVIQQIVNRGSK